MERLLFSIHINAPRNKVWSVLWNDETYRKWTSVFSEGSYAVSDWNEGSKILFLAGNGNGMYSTIIEKVENEKMVFKHIGNVKDGVEQPVDEEGKKWSGSIEEYRLEETESGTELKAAIDIVDEHKSYFTNTFPKALESIKTLSETETSSTTQ